MEGTDNLKFILTGGEYPEGLSYIGLHAQVTGMRDLIVSIRSYMRKNKMDPDSQYIRIKNSPHDDEFIIEIVRMGSFD